MDATTLTQAHNTVNLDEPLIPKLVFGLITVGLVFAAVKSVRRSSPW